MLGGQLLLILLSYAATTSSLNRQCTYMDFNGACQAEAPPVDIPHKEKVIRFQRAVGLGIATEVKHWLKAGLDPNMIGPDGNNMLWTAVRTRSPQSPALFDGHL